MLIGLLLTSCGKPESHDQSVVPTDTADEKRSPKTAPAIAAGEISSCGEHKAARFIGAVATSEIRKAVESAAGRPPIRWITPGQAITLDYSQARLNVILDERNKIAAMRCG